MLRSQNNYEFRKELLQVHIPALRNLSARPTRGETALQDGLVLLLPQNVGVVLKTAALDFCDYLQTSMELAATVKIGELPAAFAKNQLLTLAVTPVAEVKMQFTIAVDANLRLSGNSERAVAQGLYWLEDALSTRCAPFVKKGSVTRTYAFEKRTCFSGYGVDEYPDAYLAKLAHGGYTAVGVFFATGANQHKLGFYDYNTLVHRAAAYGLDVFVFSNIPSLYHPDDPAAAEYYESTYGVFLDQCPDIKGMWIVGESNEFPSKDPRCSGKLRTQNFVENIPTGKVSPGWYPCCDYPQFLKMLQGIIQKHRPNTELIFSTYNWGYMDEETRIAFLRTLPTDITLMVDMEIFAPMPYTKAVKGYCSDYTLAFAGPGPYFASEAAEAKRLGIRFNAYTGTGGLTWDLGTIPYQPAAYAWIDRLTALLKAKEDWQVVDLSESIHFGVYPSFITDLAKQMFFEPQTSPEEILSRVLQKNFGQANVAPLKKAMRLWSRGVKLSTPAVEHQYGPDRIGPSYPLCLMRDLLPPTEPYAIHGSGIFPPRYTPRNNGKCALSSVRMPVEQQRLQKMQELFWQGIHVARAECQSTPAVEEVLGIMEFWARSVQTTLNVKAWYLVTERFKIETNPAKIDELIAQMEQIALAEIENARGAIPLVQANSRLGWEPSMEYQTDEAHLRWKIRQVEYVLNTELAQIKASRALSEK